MQKLLIINDDIAFCRVLQRVMSSRHYDVRICHTCNDAAQIAGTFSPDFVLLDLSINGENGMSLIPELKDIKQDCIVVIFTSYGTIQSAVWAVRNGASDYVTKPADADELDHLLKRCANIKTTLPEILSSPEEVKEAHILEFFEKNDRRIATTARMLGLHRRTLQRILARLGLDGNGPEFAKRATPIGRAKRIMRLWSMVMAKRKMPPQLGTRPGQRQVWTSEIQRLNQSHRR